MKETVILKSNSEKSTEAALEVEELSFSYRLTKAAFRSAMLIICGVFGAIVPPHFIIPLICLGAAAYVGKSAYSQKKMIISGEGKCPECGATFKIFKRVYKFPLLDVCEGCRREITVTAPKPY